MCVFVYLFVSFCFALFICFVLFFVFVFVCLFFSFSVILDLHLPSSKVRGFINDCKFWISLNEH